MLKVDPGRCSGCRRCEIHCAFFHSGKTGHLGARIKVEKIESLGIDYPVVCHQCKEHYCTRCPENAISITELGSIEVSPTLCTLCGACEHLCPIGAIEIYHNVPHVCDLCGGSPRCVQACEMDAISYDPEIRQSVTLAQFKKKARKLTPSRKRYEYAMHKGKALREKWVSDRKAQ